MIIRKHRFSDYNLSLIHKALEIIKMFKDRNISITLRQLYYQFVANGIIPNTSKEYAKLSALITNARYAAYIPWTAIEDRIRIPRRHSQFYDLEDLVNAAKASYRLDRWEGQEYYVEVWTEKDALSSVIEPLTLKYHVYLSINRGYSSASAMYYAYKRFLNESYNKQCIILYLGDHDPSGLDMVRDIRDRLYEFGVDVECKHIALTTEQVEKYSPPPNPAKVTDPRASEYISKFGKTSWEVDAIRPDTLIHLIETNIQKYLDVIKLDEVISKEKRDIKKLESIIKGKK